MLTGNVPHHVALPSREAFLLQLVGVTSPVFNHPLQVVTGWVFDSLPISDRKGERDGAEFRPKIVGTLREKRPSHAQSYSI